MTTEYRYRGRDVKDVKERAEQQGGSFDRYTDMAIPILRVGRAHTLRILPPPYDIDIDRWGKNWGIQIFVHYNVGPDKGTYLCPNKMEKGNCPVCEARAEQDLQQGDPDPLKPTLRYLCYVIDRDNEREGPLLWALPWTIEREIQSLSLDGKQGILEIDHPDEGYDVSFTREGKGIATKWVGVKIARKSSPIHENPKTQTQWLRFIEENPLPDTLHFETYKYLDKVYRAKAPKKDDERRSRDDDDDRPARRDDDATAERRDRRTSERPGRYTDDAADENVPEGVSRSTRSRTARGESETEPSRDAEAAEEREAPRRRARETARPATEKVPEAATRADLARDRVNRLKADANGKGDPEDNNEDEEGQSSPPRQTTERQGEWQENRGRPQRRKNPDDDEAPY